METEQWEGPALMPKAWVCEQLNKHKKPYEYQVIYMGKCVALFTKRDKADELVRLMNLLLKGE
jgi:hypothetical protein